MGMVSMYVLMSVINVLLAACNGWHLGYLSPDINCQPLSFLLIVNIYLPSVNIYLS